MKTREQYKKDFESDGTNWLVIEVLLDIRDLLKSRIRGKK